MLFDFCFKLIPTFWIDSNISMSPLSYWSPTWWAMYVSLNIYISNSLWNKDNLNHRIYISKIGNSWVFPNNFLRFVFYLEVRTTHRDGHIHTHTHTYTQIPATGSVAKWPQWPTLSQAEGRSQEVHLHLPRVYRGPDPRAIFHCFSQTISRDLDWEWSSWKKNMHSLGML